MCLLWLWGCQGDPQDPDEIRTAGLLDASCAERYAGPIVIDRIRSACDEDSQLWIELETLGWASHAVWTLVGTAAQDPWSEAHVLQSAGFDPCGAWDVLRLEAVATSSEAWTPGLQTRFSCDQLQRTPPVLTRVIRLYALDGSLAECLVGGHDPAGLLAGGYDASLAAPPAAPEELDRCRIVEPLPGQTPTW